MGQTSPTADFQGGAPMQRIRTIEVPAQVGERVHIAGWLHSLRRLGGVSFVVIRDGWGLVQAVAESERELAPLAVAGAGNGSIIAIEGIVTRAEQAPHGVELRDLLVEVISPVAEPAPV